jgi:mono/diheme cytochrome c family protein
MGRSVRWIVAAFFLLLSSPVLAAEDALFSPTQDPVAGSRIFGAKGCVRCHAINGVGGKIGPDLGRIPRPRSFYDLAAAMWNHFPRMVARMKELGISRPHLDTRETGHLIAFLYTLNYFDPPGNPQAGKKLFTEKRCVVCHQVGGAGGVVGPNLDFLKQYGSPIFVAAAMWNHGPAMAEAMRARGITRPTFTATELIDLIAYLKAASPAPVEEPLYVLPGRASEGHRLFVERGCQGCHGVRGEGGKVGPDLAERGLHKSLTEFAAAMWNKIPAMIAAMKAKGIAVPQLQPQEMADIVAYLYSVRYFAEPGDPRRGEQLVMAKGCLGCHPVRGKGGKGAGDLARAAHFPSPAAAIAAMWNHALIMEDLAQPKKMAWPQFRPDEMADLVAYLQELRRSR